MVPKMQEGEKIILARTEWVIPTLRAKQMVKVVPALLQMAADISSGELRSFTTKGVGGADILVPAFTERQMTTLLDATFDGLSWNYPDLKREQFDNMTISHIELFNALPVLQRAAGMKPAEDGDNQQLGEAGAQTSQTGSN